MVRAMMMVLLALGLSACERDRDETLPHEVPETTSPGPDSTALPPPTMELQPGQAATGQEEPPMGMIDGDREDGMGCDASKAEWIVGKQPTDELLEQAAADAGAEVARYLRHDEMVTMEYHPSRLNVDLDEDGVIRSVRCG